MKKKNDEQKPTPNRWTTVYKDILTMTDKPVPKVFIDRLCDEMLEWARNDNLANNISQFTAPRGMKRTLLNYLCSQHPQLKEAYELTLETLGARRETNALIKDWDSNYAKQMQHFYLPEWKESLPFKLAKDTQGALEVSNQNFLNQIILGNGEIIDVGSRGK